MHQREVSTPCTASWINDSRSLIESRLAALLPSQKSPLTDAMRYSLLAPGKRIRPLLTVAAAELFGGSRDAALDTACAIEIVHTASLVFDDLPCMDNDTERREQATVHTRFGESLAILSGISLLTHTYCILASQSQVPMADRLKVIQLLCDTIGPAGLSLGQYMDLQYMDMNASSKNPSMDLLSELHHLKTGVLFLAAAKAGCILAHATPEDEQNMVKFAIHFGQAYQLLDDVSDLGDTCTNIVTHMGMRKAESQIRQHLSLALSPFDQHQKRWLLEALIQQVFPQYAISQTSIHAYDQTEFAGLHISPVASPMR